MQNKWYTVEILVYFKWAYFLCEIDEYYESTITSAEQVTPKLCWLFTSLYQWSELFESLISDRHLDVS